MSHVYAKLGVANRTELATLATVLTWQDTQAPSATSHLATEPRRG